MPAIVVLSCCGPPTSLALLLVSPWLFRRPHCAKEPPAAAAAAGVLPSQALGPQLGSDPPLRGGPGWQRVRALLPSFLLSSICVHGCPYRQRPLVTLDFSQALCDETRGAVAQGHCGRGKNGRWRRGGGAPICASSSAPSRSMCYWNCLRDRPACITDSPGGRLWAHRFAGLPF